MTACWDRQEAEAIIAGRSFDQVAEQAVRDAGPCPNCGAPAIVDLIDTSTMHARSWLPGIARCSANCFVDDPESYLAATAPVPKVIADPGFIDRGTGGGKRHWWQR